LFILWGIFSCLHHSTPTYSICGNNSALIASIPIPSAPQTSLVARGASRAACELPEPLCAVLSPVSLPGSALLGEGGGGHPPPDCFLAHGGYPLGTASVRPTSFRRQLNANGPLFPAQNGRATLIRWRGGCPPPTPLSIRGVHPAGQYLWRRAERKSIRTRTGNDPWNFKKQKQRSAKKVFLPGKHTPGPFSLWFSFSSRRLRHWGRARQGSFRRTRSRGR